MNFNYYEILECDENATQKEIKKSYYKLAKIYHPDKNKGHEEKFKKISEAYNTLIDENKKKEYDLKLKFGNNLNNNYSSEFYTYSYDINFMDILRMANSVKKMYQEIYVQKVLIDISVSLKEVLHGVEKTINIPYTDLENKKRSEIHKISIPKGIKNEEILILENKGNFKKNGKRTNVECKINYLKHQTFNVKNYDLHCNMEISFKDSILLPNINLKNLDDETITFKCDKVITNKTLTRIKNQGLPKSDNIRGDIVVHFNVVYPEFTIEQKNIIRNYF